ncbi:MAG: hypothetical protein ACKOW9_05105 [Candidatus Paceibacterota bacterium]
MSLSCSLLPDLKATGPLTIFDGNIIVGLDCETSARSLVDGGRLIQFGLSYYDGVGGYNLLSEYVRWDSMKWEDQAEGIHNISKEMLLDMRYANDIDESLYKFIKPLNDSGLNLIAAGYNVGSFDLPFFHHAFPETMRLFSHRVVDLNSICFILDSVNGVSAKTHPTPFKSILKEYSNDLIQSHLPNLDPHDAGYDALEAIFSITYIQRYLSPLL